jgi:hypothetical protein
VGRPPRLTDAQKAEARRRREQGAKQRLPPASARLVPRARTVRRSAAR